MSPLDAFDRVLGEPDSLFSGHRAVAGFGLTKYRVDGFLVIGPERPLEQGDRGGRFLGAFLLASGGDEHPRQGHSDLGLDLGLPNESGPDLLSGVEHHVDKGRAGAQSLGRDGHEHVVEQVVSDCGAHLLGAVRAFALLDRDPAFFLGVAPLNIGLGRERQGRAQPDREHQHRGDGASHEPAMTACELGHVVERRRGPGQDRLMVEVSADVFRERRGGLVPVLAVLCDRASHDRDDVPVVEPRDGVVPAVQRRGLLVANDPGRLGNGLAAKLMRHSSGEEFVENHADRVDVGACVDVAVELLDAHVPHGADQEAGFRQPSRIVIAVEDPRDTKVQDHGMGAGGQQAGAGRALSGRFFVGGDAADEDVRGLEVSVDDALGVGVLDGVGESSDQFETRGEIERVRFRVVEDVRSCDVLHRVVRDRLVAALRGSRLKDAGDTGVCEPAEHADLTRETHPNPRGPHPGAEDLERDLPIGV